MTKTFRSTYLLPLPLLFFLLLFLLLLLLTLHTEFPGRLFRLLGLCCCGRSLGGLLILASENIILIVGVAFFGLVIGKITICLLLFVLLCRVFAFDEIVGLLPLLGLLALVLSHGSEETAATTHSFIFVGRWLREFLLGLSTIRTECGFTQFCLPVFFLSLVSLLLGRHLYVCVFLR